MALPSWHGRGPSRRLKSPKVARRIKRRVKRACTVEFRKDAAVLFDKHGHSINMVRFPKGHKLSAKARAATRRRLMKGCAELSRR